MTPGAGAFRGRDRVEAQQWTSLRKLLATLLPNNRFYAEKLAAAGVGRELSGLGEFFAGVPFTRKQELVEDQRRHPPYGSNLTYPVERYTRFSQTSGTTGRPLRWLDTPESWEWMLANWEKIFRTAGVGAGDRIFFAFSFGPFLGFWTAFESAARTGCLCIPGGGMRSAARLRTMLDSGVTVLCATPTYAIRLAEAAAEEKLDLAASPLRVLLAAGEPGGSIPATRRLLERVWGGARVVDHHGMTETGPVSYGCPRRPDVLHVIESAYIAEVIDPDSGDAVPPGGMGELVLTNLGRTGSPLLRYRTGDLVRRAAEARCACGTSDLALEGGILGRTDDMVVVRGVNVYPSAIEDVLRAGGGVAEYRVSVRNHHALAELAIEVEPIPDHPEPMALARALEARLHETLALRIPVRTVPCGALPRFEMKAQRWVRV